MERVKIAGAVKEAGSSRGNKTGSWRSFKPVVTGKCIGCGQCVPVCPDFAIRVEVKKAKINYDYCKGCLICLGACPVKAIKKEEE